MKVLEKSLNFLLKKGTNPVVSKYIKMSPLGHLFITWENSRHFLMGWLPHEMMSEEQEQNFHTDDVSLPRSE